MRAPALLASVLLCVVGSLAVAGAAAVPASASVAASAAAVPAPDICGGTLADYVGAASPDTAFTGYLDANGARTPFTVTPKDVAGTVRAEIKPAHADPDTVVGVESAAAVEQAWDGSAMFVFNTPRGQAESDALECAAGGSTRVTKIYGTVLMGGDHLESFVVSRG